MKIKHLFLLIVAVLLGFPLSRSFAAPQVTFEVLATFDYPGATYTQAGAINDSTMVVGSYDSGATTESGFRRFRNGHFGPAINDPNSDANITAGYGINNLREICGVQQTLDGHDHGFVLSGRTFTEVNIEGATDTAVIGINDAGNLCGNWYDGLSASSAWVSIDGTITSFKLPSSLTNGASAINNLNQCVGIYIAVGGHYHSFFRDADGTLTYPIDTAGQRVTVLNGINDLGQMVGEVWNDESNIHGIIYQSLGGKSATYDYPGATSTFFTGINRRGIIAGSYVDTAGAVHGLLVRVRN